MNDFLYQELLAEEYRRDQVANAEKYNRFQPTSGKTLNLSIYRTLSRMGEHLEGLGAKMQDHYTYLAHCEEGKMQLNPAK